MTRSTESLIADLPPHFLDRLRKGDLSRKRLRTEMGWNTGEAKRVHEHFSNLRTRQEVQAEELETRQWEQEGGTATCTLVTADSVKTEEDLYEVADIDSDEWKVEKLEVKAWNGQQKGPGDEPLIVQMHSVSARLSRRFEERAVEAVAEDVLEEIRAGAPEIVSRDYATEGADRMLLLALPDTHFGKWAAKGEAPWTVQDALEVHGRVVDDLLKRASGQPIERVVYIVGNDITQVDNASGSTTSGTQVEYWDSWRDQYRAARKASTNAILRSLEVAPVDVLVVPGNHDENTTFTLGEVLDARFSGDKHVSVDNGDRLRKYYKYGINLLGATHGKEVKKNEMPMLMANERPSDWAATKWREWHTGHIHSRKKSTPGDYVELNGVIVRVSPSLAPSDCWHVRRGFIGAMRGAEAFLYHKTQGLDGIFSYNVLD